MVFSNVAELAFGLASFGTGVFSLLLAIAIFLGNPYVKANRVWSLTSLSVALWGGGLGFAILSPDERMTTGITVGVIGGSTNFFPTHP